MSFEYNTLAIDKWELEKYMDVITQFEDELAENTHQRMCINNNYQTILLHIAGKSILTIREILTLCAHGYPDGAIEVIQKQNDEKIRKLLGMQYARYKRACISLHASCMGNTKRIGNHTDFDVVDTAPTVYGQSTALVYATISLISIVGFVCSEFQIDNTKYLKQLNELALYYQRKEKDMLQQESGE